MKRAAALLSIITIISGCAAHPDKIPSQYISPIQYSGYSCKQISEKMQRVSSRVSDLGGKQESAANKSAVMVGVGFIFWPAFFFVDSNSAQAAEYAKLKGEFETLDQVATHKNCKLQVVQS